MISRKIGFNIRNAPTPTSASHSSMLASRRRRRDAMPENWTVRRSREFSVTFLPCRDLNAECVAPLLYDLRYALGDFGDRRPDDLEVLGRHRALDGRNL